MVYQCNDEQYKTMVVTRIHYILKHSESIWYALAYQPFQINCHQIERFLFEMDLERYRTAFLKINESVENEENQNEYRYTSLQHFDFIMVCLYEFIEKQTGDSNNKDRKLCALETIQKIRNKLYQTEPDVFQENSDIDLKEEKLNMEENEDLPGRSRNDIGVKENGLIDYLYARAHTHMIVNDILNKLEIEPKLKKVR